jgi:Flp pilus assembly protein TadD
MNAPLVRVAVAVVLLAAFFAAFQRSAADRSQAVTVSLCEIDMPRDAAALEACLAVAPDHVEIMLALGSAYEATNDGGHAEELYRRALGVDPHDGEARLRLARLLRQRGDVTHARLEGERALAIRPNSAEAMALARP